MRNKISFLLVGLLLFGSLFSLSQKKIYASVGGSLDFSEKVSFVKNTKLDTEWYFFSEQLLNSDEIKLKLSKHEGSLVKVPTSFESHTSLKNTYGTYALWVKLPRDAKGHPLAIQVPYQYSAYALYVNDQLIAKNGVVGDEKTHEAMMAPKLGYFTPTQDEVLLVMQISSFEHIRGGFENSIFIGNEEAIIQKANAQLIFNLFTTGVIFSVGILMVLLTLHQKSNYGNLVFGLFAFFIAVRSLFAVPFYYTFVFPNMSWLWGTRFEYLLTSLTVILFYIYMWSLYRDIFSERVIFVSIIGALMTMVVTLFTKPVFFQDFFFKVFLLGVLVSFYVIYVVIKSIKVQSNKVRYNLIGIGIVILAFLNDYLIGLDVYQGPEMMLFAVAIYVFLQMSAFSRDYARFVAEQARLNIKLATLNSSLNEKVKERTQQLEEANNHLQILASKDGLTGIYNRKKFNETIEQAFLRANQFHQTTALFMMDIDYFKLYNDTYGHPEGDKVLLTITQLVQSIKPKETFFARYGGEEFALVWEDTTYDEAFALGQKICAQLEALGIEHLQSHHNVVTISIGVAMISSQSDYRNVSQWIDAADRQLYVSKLNGKNRVS